MDLIVTQEIKSYIGNRYRDKDGMWVTVVKKDAIVSKAPTVEKRLVDAIDLFQRVSLNEPESR
jgi:hypothetical protein